MGSAAYQYAGQRGIGAGGRPDINAFEAVMTREDRTKGFFVAFDYTRDALREIDGFFRRH